MHFIFCYILLLIFTFQQNLLFSQISCLVFYDLKYFLKQKIIVHATYKSSNSHPDYLKFSSLCAKCKSQSKIDHYKYISNTEFSLKINPKQFWFFLKTIISSPDFPDSLSLNDVVTNDGKT